jgi:hypothetical protein
MGQKINPTGFRLSVNRDWASKWYANSKHFASTLNEDIKVRDYLARSWPTPLSARSRSSARRKCAHHHP